MTPADYLNRLERYQSRDDDVKNFARILNDVSKHLHDRPNEVVFGSLPEIGDARLFAGCKSFNADEFPNPSEIQEVLDARIVAIRDCNAAWLALNDSQRRNLPTPPRWQ